MIMTDTVIEEEDRSCSVVREQTPEDEDGHLTDGTKGSVGSAHEKDSGISRATDSDPELPPPINSPSKCSQKSTNSGSGTATTVGTGKDASTPEYFLDFASHLTNKNALSRRFGDAGGGAESEQSSAATPTQANQRSIGGGSDTPKGSSSNCGTSTFNWRPDSDDASLERELHFLHEEMEHIQLECDRLIEQHARSENQVRAQMEQANRLAASVLNLQKQQKTFSTDSASSKFSSPSKVINSSKRSSNPFSAIDGHQQSRQSLQHHQPGNGRLSARDETSSAYNTGNESCRSTPLKTVGLGTDHHPVASTVCSDGKRDSAMFTLPPPVINRQFVDPSILNAMAPQIPIDYPPKRNGVNAAVQPSDLNGLAAPPVGSQPLFYAGDIMYTNSENLQRTILLQQRLLRQAMIQQAQQLRAQHQMHPQAPIGDPGAFCTIPEQQAVASMNWTDNDRLRWLVQQQQGSTQQFNETDIVKMEWKIKRRADGSRYLARRPVRNKILKERAEKLSSERCGVSTDDDALSELKIGKYWTREERKKHLERAKERKRRQEELLRRKAESLRQTTDQPILQLSNKKMLRRQGQQLFDKFTTVQEFLAHGSRSADGAGRALGILSVTTV